MTFREVAGQDAVKSTLLQGAKNERLPHAQMFCGPEGSGKLQLAFAHAQFLLCQNPQDSDSCNSCSSCKLTSVFSHPDLHVAFPISISKETPDSEGLIESWKEHLDARTYITLDSWLNHLNELGKKPVIGVDESQRIQKKLLLRSALGGYKIMIVWMAELMNTAAANKLLKLLEEPPDKTLLLLTCINPDLLPATVLSRVQMIRVPPVADDDVKRYLGKFSELDADKVSSIVSYCQGNVSVAVDLARSGGNAAVYFDFFVQMMRTAYAASPLELVALGEKLATLEREQQKSLLTYALKMIRECLMRNYLGAQIANTRPEESVFLDKFARFINNQNIDSLLLDFNDAYLQIERNANPKILFTDLMIRLTKLIKKAA